MSAAAGLALGAGALWLLSQMRGGASAPTGVDPNAGGVAPGTVPQNSTSKDVQIGSQYVSLGIGAAGTVVSILKGAGVIGGGAATGGTAAAGGGSAAGGGAASPVVQTGAAISAGFFSAGPIYIAAAIIIAVAATMIATGISANITNKHYWEQTILMENTNPVLFATKLFQQLTAKMTKWLLPNGQPLPAGWSTANGYQTIELSPEQLRQVGLACLYIATWIPQAKNDGLVRYYSFMGWTPQQMANTPVMQTVAAGNAWPGRNFFAELPTNALSSILAPLQTMFAAARPPNISGNPVWNAVTAPFTQAELKNAAVQVFGVDLPKIEDSMKFAGTLKAVYLAAIEGYGATGGSWQTFVETIGQFMGWTPAKAVYFVTNAPQPYGLDTWWLIDPATGNRMAILETHSDNVLRLSIKGAPIMPGVPNSPLAGVRVVGRRFARFGNSSSQCVNDKGEFVSGTCPPVAVASPFVAIPMTASAAAAAERARAASVSARSGSMVLPVAALGAAALYFLLKKRA